MPQSPLRLIQEALEYIEKDSIKNLNGGLRGIYVLYKLRRQVYEVVYVGLSDFSIRNRLRSHRRKKGDKWSHFSVFKVWDNITDQEIQELEGLFRHIYRKNVKSNKLNRQRGFKKLKKLSGRGDQILKNLKSHS